MHDDCLPAGVHIFEITGAVIRPTYRGSQPVGEEAAFALYSNVGAGYVVVKLRNDLAPLSHRSIEDMHAWQDALSVPQLTPETIPSAIGIRLKLRVRHWLTGHGQKQQNVDILEVHETERMISFREKFNAVQVGKVPD